MIARTSDAKPRLNAVPGAARRSTCAPSPCVAIPSAASGLAQSVYRRIWHLWGTSYIYWVNTEFKLYEMTNNRPTQHPELSLISLGRPVASEDGELPRGASGTVLHVYPQALAYEVEFFEPFHTVATVEATAIRE
jgi:hypothetical protein